MTETVEKKVELGFGPKHIIEREGYKYSNGYTIGMQFPACCGVFIIYSLYNHLGQYTTEKEFETLLKDSEKLAIFTGHSVLLFFINETQYRYNFKIIEERGCKMFHSFYNSNSRRQVYGYLKNL